MSKSADTKSGLEFGPIAGGLLAVALILGGAARLEVLSTLLVRLVAIGVLVVLVARQDSFRSLGRHWPAFILVALVALQLVPLPFGVWSSLPGRQLEVDIFSQLPNPHPWMPLSMHPPGTFNTLLSLLPPLALLMSLPLVGLTWRRRLIYLLIAIALINGVFGMLQLAMGEESPLRLYAVTNRDSAVGLFANRNHSASLMACAIPFLLWWAATPSAKLPGSSRGLLAAGAVCILFISIAATASRSGIVLALGATLVSILAYHGGRLRRLSWRVRVGVIVGAVLLTVIALGLFPLVLSRFAEASPAEDLRFLVLNDLAGMARAVFPAGSGFGTFDVVYRGYENVDILRPTYLNHAHNDLIELIIEGGLPAFLLLLAALIWYARTAVRAAAARRQKRPEAELAVAALLAVAILFAHSIFDYPLRTPALACVLALATGLLLPPVARRARRGALSD
ncbi:O-antigen ligase family protein [Sphingomonas psychrotolerans]|nr:O-antigen ligase family protein [Sphingomonas psychrotolerans]